MKIEFENAISKMAKDANRKWESRSNNPRVPSYDEIKELYRKCFDYKYCVFYTKLVLFSEYSFNYFRGNEK